MRQLRMQNSEKRFANRSAVRNLDSSALQPDLRILWNISIFQRIAYHSSFSMAYAIFHADGQLAEGDIALAEVQGYVYAAKRQTARVARRLGREAFALELDAEATRLAERFEA